ncbi:hypothetical protein EYZ11_004471 [Aspergillus tanneri]|uniref:Metallo-beta-lactamase domain-containing protein n=1 Tax=Aspergillus tanneri TaxID=1220188 RepID=A0A4S3JL22_9EURO|nr:uncharacterized protein ATNIH1004_008246 [Aspergillus tanneri]KAA8644049.1 hypothetical protein ATNIH1004_008246 [Aspergillus tanneri]THC96050.1 hypothetical protein EYZ11_004471 [Aspergillus tanneri]
MDISSCLVSPKTPPPLHIPSSTSVVTVRVIDSTTSLFLDPPLFWRPEIKGLDGVTVPDFCFLVSNGSRHILFDLGVRRDWENYAPRTVDLIRRTTRVHVDKNVAEILDAQEQWSGPVVRSKDIEAVIWSHHHFDHIGDPSTFPPSTDLVVGPGVKALCWPAYPTQPDSPVLDADAQGRNVREITFSRDSPHVCRIGRFDAFDFFGDGSFYLLDAPGHSVGHLVGLARVSATGPGSFVLMGADACHHPGILRPTEYLPIPTSLSPSPIRQWSTCPGDRLRHLHPRGSATEPFLTVSPVLFPDLEAAQDTVRKIQELDAAENILVILSHDQSIKDHIDLFPLPINDWMAKGVAGRTRWLFCGDFEGALD